MDSTGDDFSTAQGLSKRLALQHFCPGSGYNPRMISLRPAQPWLLTRCVPVLSLGTLHLALLFAPGSLANAAWLLVHLGLFLLWQPVAAPARPLARTSIAGLGMLALMLITGMPALVLVWQVTLAALLAGPVFATRLHKTRYFQLGLLADVVWQIMVHQAPVSLHQAPLPADMFNAGGVWLALMLFIPPQAERRGAQAPVDFLLSLTVFLLIMLDVLLALALSVNNHWTYLYSLVAATLVEAGTLLLLVAIWAPSGGRGGLGIWIARYLLNISTPFEQWTATLAQLAEQPLSAGDFLRLGTTELLKLDWVLGGSWRFHDDDDRFGGPSGAGTTFQHGGLSLDIITNAPLSPALRLHCSVLVRLLEAFATAKLRERELAQQAYLRAVHESGARLTHDIKNVLQSLHTLTGAADMVADDEAPRLVALVRRQLPALNQRLADLLTQLRTPETPLRPQTMGASIWWSLLLARYGHANIEFQVMRLRESDRLPAPLFDCVADNLIANALRKRGSDNQLRIQCALYWDDGIVLLVSDTGSAIAAKTTASLFTEAIADAEGTGLGLYQAARMAKNYGFHLQLLHNVQGHVALALLQDVKGHSSR